MFAELHIFSAFYTELLFSKELPFFVKHYDDSCSVAFLISQIDFFLIPAFSEFFLLFSCSWISRCDCLDNLQYTISDFYLVS